MKVIIIGLGNFGSSLGEKLTQKGNEVIGIDNSMNKVELFKEKISHTICMDSTDEVAVSGLPLKETDMVIVAIGEDQGSNVMTTALFKNLKVERLISRAINPLHEKVLKAIGVDEIVHPEEETAERWAKKLCIKNVIDSFELDDEHSIIEVKTPEKYIGKTVREIDLKRKHNILILTTIKKTESKSLLGNSKLENIVQGVASADTVIAQDDVLVLYSSNKDLESFLEK
ncbi:potassium channel family protein [Psychroflexus maritimus]|uniref:TrkA family potassium uptake protein n=1 Tax=Psychroflexus maritimus TaxID=2714865 RepID=A0A967DYE6_9FLAO|nr:TrkA family potassium uptake protein [Psychroflexus maritimus]NGZ89735.1 TrkA family potassium uptake protein [Psychroflexus maritimus]